MKLRPNLTINAGLRYEYYSVVQEKNGRDKVWRLVMRRLLRAGHVVVRPGLQQLRTARRLRMGARRASRTSTVIRARLRHVLRPRAERRRVRADRQRRQPHRARARDGADAAVSDRPVPPARGDDWRRGARRRRASRRSVRGSLQRVGSAGVAVALDDADRLRRQPGVPHARPQQYQSDRSRDRTAAAAAIRTRRHQGERLEHELQRAAALAASAR